nr:hypothetical protein [Tanacetum cinerariifolium]
DSPFNLVAYSDSDYAGESLDRKSTTGGYQFLGCRMISWQCKKQTVVATSSTEAKLISWQCKKQTVVATSLTEAEYIDAASGCAQVLWMQNQLLDYGAQVGDLSSHCIKCSSPALTQKVFANMRRVGKGFSRVETPLFEGMIVAQQADDVVDEGVAGVDVDVVPAAADEPSIPSPTSTTQPPPPSQELPCTSHVLPTPPPSPIAEPSSPPQQQQLSQSTHDNDTSMDLLHTLLEICTTLTRKVEALEQDKVVQALEIIKLKQRVKKLERKNKLKVSGLRRLREIGTAQRVESSGDTVMDDVEVEKTTEIEENVDVQGRQAESQAQINQIDLEHADKVVTATSATITPATIRITAATLTTAPSAARRRKGVVIRDPKETATPSIIIHSKPKSKDKGTGIMVEEPKPLKKEAQIEQDEAYARELEAELNKIINWDEVIEQVQRKENEDNAVIREDLEVLWQLVKERFASSKPKNFSDDFLLTTLTYMFKKPDV